MSVIVEDGQAVKPRRRTAVKPPMRAAAPKVKSTILLSPEASQRLSVHAAMLNEDRSALVDRLIMEHLRLFRVQDLRKADPVRDVGEDRQTEAA